MDRQQFTAKVEAALVDYCQTKQGLSSAVGLQYVTLWENIQKYLLGGGKRVRPYLVYLTYKAYGGAEDEAIVPIAMAWELLHACLLIHDDIIDRDTLRHGHPNIAGIYEELYKDTAKDQAPHYALSAALLAGDLLLSATYELINESMLSSEMKLIAQRHVINAMFAVGGGELIDFESALRPIQSVDAYAIAQYKTATYSFQLPMQCGAVLARASKQQLEILDSLGEQIGIAFQLRDDLLGVFGDEETTGKSNRSDIFEKKRTVLVQEAQKQLSKDRAEYLEALYHPGKSMTESEAEEAYELIKNSGAKAKVESEISKRVVRADKLVSRLEISDEVRGDFLQLIDKVAIRSR